jgi:nucleotide-binding universal stress UspA family protein
MSPRPIVVGIDGGESGRDAVALGHRLGELLGAPLDVVTATGSSPAEMLHDAAEAQDAALVVLGATHRHAIARTVHGTVRRLLPETPCPVAVAPAGFAECPQTPVRRVGVGFEPTPEGEAALAMAHSLAGRAGADLRAIGVALPLGPLAFEDLTDRAPFLEEERRAVEAGLTHALAELPAGVPSVADARLGDAAVELAAASQELDLLVCGSRRRSPLRVVLLGSVTERLLRSAACPLVIVPRPSPIAGPAGMWKTRIREPGSTT